MIIDRLLYLLVPKFLHDYATQNRAKIRTQLLSMFIAVVGFSVDQINALDVEYAMPLATLLMIIATQVTGRRIHNVVTPYLEEPAAYEETI